MDVWNWLVDPDRVVWVLLVCQCYLAMFFLTHVIPTRKD